MGMDEEHPGSDLVVSEGMVMMTTTIVDTAGGEGATKKITTLAPRPKKRKPGSYRNVATQTPVNTYFKGENSGKDTRSRKETRQKWKRQCHPDPSVKPRLKTNTVSSKRNLRERRRML